MPAYPEITMRLPEDLSMVFGSRALSSRRTRSDLASTQIRSSFREVGVILQPLSSCSSTEIAEYISESDCDSAANIEHINYGDFDDHFDEFDNFSCYDGYYDDFDDDYTPLYFGVFMVDNETEAQKAARLVEEERLRLEREEQERWLKEDEDRRQREDKERRRRDLANRGRNVQRRIDQTIVDNTNVFLTPQQNAVGAITLLDTIIPQAPVHLTPTLNRMKTMIAATVPDDLGGNRQPIDV